MVNPPLPRVLILQDERHARPELAGLMAAAGFEVAATAAPSQALTWMTDDVYDVILIDLDTHDLNGIPLMQAVRRMQPDLQIVVLTSRPTLLTAIAAIRAGATDYLIKPIEGHLVLDSVRRSLDSLAALKSQLSRLVREVSKINAETEAEQGPGQNGSPLGSIIMVPPFRLDYTRRQVTILNDSNRTVDLSRGETSVLACLMSNPDQPMTTPQLARLAWNYEMDAQEASELVRPYIHRLRRKLEETPNDPCQLITVRGMGYLFASDHSSVVIDD